jgi:phospholipid/cholesterol/gamma-HCH transport system ATP-binding protein
MTSSSTHANDVAQQRLNRDVIISVRDLVVGFGDKTIMKGLSLDVYRGEVLGFVGGSGQGKSVLTRAILGLVPTRGGAIRVFGQDRDALAPLERRALEQRWGVLFQNGALFSGLTVKQNIQMPMREMPTSQRLMDELAMLKLDLLTLVPTPRTNFRQIVGRHGEARSLARHTARPELVFQTSRHRDLIRSAPPNSTS